MVGEENCRGNDQPKDDSADDGADHDGVLGFAGASAGALPGASGGVPRRATSSSWRCASAASTARRWRAICNHGAAASALAPLSRSSAATARSEEHTSELQ